MSKTEFEVRVPEINIHDIISKLTDLDALLVSDSLQKRFVYDFHPASEDRWIRLRTNGKETTLTIKEIESSKVDGTKETEVKIKNEDFYTMDEILRKLGYNSKSYQENRRIKYNLDGVEVDIDFWPLIPPYLEIEGKSKEEVYDTLSKLNIPIDYATSLDVQRLYKEKYGINLRDYDKLLLEEEKKSKFVTDNTNAIMNIPRTRK